MSARGTHRADEVDLGATLFDALESAMSPEVAMRVVVAALQRADRSSLPRDPEAMSRFVVGPLREAIEEALDEETYGLVSDRLAPLLVMASSGVRARSAATTVPAATLLVVTRDPDFAARTRAELGAHVEMAQIDRPLELVGHTTRARSSGGRLLVIVDARLPSIDLRTVAALSTPAEPIYRVLLVGASDAQVAKIREHLPTTRRWLTCSIEETASAARRALGSGAHPGRA